MFARAGIVAVIALLLWSVLATGSDGAGEPRIHTVKRYDTLWSIAVAHYAGDPRDGVWRLRERNDLEGTLIRPGQRLLVPP